ncbi:MAG: hypothetical protein QNJ98_04440 [Planctomycetota bacterium]|nr:hypothetical protein [Planctomycetota bacterium]
MEFLTTLWLPILLSAVFVFIVSSIIHMVLPYHRSNWKKIEKETEVLAAMREGGVTPGLYMFPCPASMKDASTPEHLEKCKLGPVGFMIIKPSGLPNIGAMLGQWFGFSLLVGVFAAYITKFALPGDPHYTDVFRMAGTVAFMGYGLGTINESIFKGQPWNIAGKFLFDGLIYALITAGTFGWLWQ